MTPGRDDASWPAPAKLNLFLHVTGRRADGWHDLQTVFQILDWGDRVRVRLAPEGVHRDRPLPGVPEDGDLSIRAAHLLRDTCGVRQGARIALYKRIPPGSGLGGASSDAATVLHALNRLWGCELGVGELAQLGLELGADVPVFIHGHSAFAEGVGERLTPISLGVRHYLLVFPGIPVATASIFADPTLPRNTTPISPSDVRGPVDFAAFRNDCEEVALRRYPALRRLIGELENRGDVRMTGTGSTLFLRYASAAAARRAARDLKSRYNVRAVTGLDRSPLLERLGGGLRDG